MARKRTEFSPAGQARFLALMDQGWTAKAIAEDLNASGERTTRSTVDARMRERRGRVATPRSNAAQSFAQELAARGGAPSVPEPMPEADTLPTEADIEEAARGGPATIDGLLASFVASYHAAPPGPVRQRWGSLILKGLDDRRKATPPERPDPNDSIDMVRLGAEVEERYLAMIDLVLEER